MRLAVLLIMVPMFAYAADPTLLPNDTESPGAVNPAVTQDNIQETICHRGWSAKARPPVDFTEPLKQRLLQEHSPGATLHAFELDHRVPIEAGGCPNCTSNLWIQPWRDPAHHHCTPTVLMDTMHCGRQPRYNEVKGRRNAAPSLITESLQWRGSSGP
jgi:hypothetical protein